MLKQWLKNIAKAFGMSHFLSRAAGYSPVRLFLALKAKRLYQKYYIESCSNYSSSPLVNKQLANVGIVAIRNPLNLDSEYINRICDEFKNGGNVVSYDFGFYKEGIVEGANAFYLKTKKLISTGIIDRLFDSGILAMLEGHLGTNVRLVNTSCFKICPNDFIDEGSFIWHRDSQPDHSYKLIVYLTDVEECDGAFRYMGGTHLDYNGLAQFGNSRLKGHRSEEGTVYEGSASDGVLFNNNGFHLGGRSIRNDRVVVVFNFKPSLTPCRDYFKKYSCGGVSDLEFYANPYAVWW
ncbi:MAG: hypothetical protein RPS47_07610 [Colwellia sp.]|jgi:hypothetical protein